jgi:acetoin utilization deacetylase AcuC-like enzyme
MDLFYSPAYTSAAHVFDTTRKSGWIAASLARSPIAGVRVVAPEPLTRSQLLAVHTPEHVDAVRTGVPDALAESNGFPGTEPCGMRSARRTAAPYRRRCTPGGRLPEDRLVDLHRMTIDAAASE